MYYNYNWISAAHMLLKMKNGEMIIKQEIGKMGFGVRSNNNVFNNVTLWSKICVVRRATTEISNVDLWECWGYL